MDRDLHVVSILNIAQKYINYITNKFLTINIKFYLFKECIF